MMLSITGCQSLMGSKDIPVPNNTSGTFAYTGINNDYPTGFAIFDKSGKPVKPSDKPVPGDKKPTDIVQIRFFNGSCTAEICRPGRPCQTVIIDPVNDCPK